MKIGRTAEAAAMLLATAAVLLSAVTAEHAREAIAAWDAAAESVERGSAVPVPARRFELASGYTLVCHGPAGVRAPKGSR